MPIFQKNLSNATEKKDFQYKNMPTMNLDTQQINDCCSQQPSEESIRQIAYFRWLAATGGNPVSEEESQNYWLEAERQLFENN